MIDQQQLMTSIPAGEAILLYEGERDGDYVWEIRVPIVMTVRAGGHVGSARKGVTLTIVRVPTQINPAVLESRSGNLH